MEPITIQKGDSLEADIKFSTEGKPHDISNSTFVALIKKEGQDDEDALSVQIIEPEKGENGEAELDMGGLDERGDFVLYIKSVKDDKKYTLSETPITIK